MDIRSKLKKAIINYNEKHPGRRFTQADLEPTVNPSHINNVASGRSTNKELRKKIEKFIERYE